MSTRHARVADKAVNEKNSKVLKSLLQKTPNKYCADCKKKDARWASWNLGIFICIRCSGIHRSLGVHISKVKSVDLDTWVPEQVENMVRWGNERANKYWEANLRDRKPTESNMEGWIRSKYEQKRWAMKGPIPDPSTLGGDDDDNQEPASTSTTTSTTSSVRQSPAITEKPKPKQSEFANLDAFLGSPTSSPATTHQQPAAPKQQQQQQLQGADFFFDAAPTQQQQQSTPPATSQAQKHNDFKSSILSLYSNMPAAAPQQQQQSFGGNNSFYSQMAGLNLGNTTQQPVNNNNVWAQQSNNMWGTTPVQQTQHQQQQQQPQGSQFFSSSSVTPEKKPEKRDVFADLLG